MMGILVESVVLAFVIGGILGAITANQLSNSSNSSRVPIRIDNERKHSNRR